jgi:23S rRNA pseudouridine1911/1915/1917 synthase
VHWLRRNPAQNKSYAVAGPAVASGAKEARLRYRLLFSLERYHLLEIELETGRHHQIRAQLAAIGCHIKGDLKYGAARSNPGGGIHLHARQVSFVHPVKQVPVVIEADPPQDPVWDAALALWRDAGETARASGV